jgi:peptidoglycan/LPS O-acetylase OafA/YrhL
MNKIKNLKILTGIRFYAALHVVLYHNFYLFGEGAKNAPVIFLRFIEKGNSAVGFFFILSGFILTHVYQGKLTDKKSKHNYLKARIARLYPLYFLALLMDLPRGLSYFFDKFEFKTALMKIMISLGAHVSMMQSWHPRLTPAWNSPAWSLSTEMFFYLIFIIAMPFILKRRKSITKLFVLYSVPLLLYCVVCMLKPELTTESSFVTFWRSFPPIRAFEFLIGICLYNLIITGHSILKYIKENTSLVFWGSVVSSLLLSQVSIAEISNVYSSLFLIPFFSLMILSSYYGEIIGERLFTSKLIQLLGGSSYALYVTHQPFKNYVGAGLDESISTGILYFSSVIVLSIILYKWVEMPCQKFLRSKIIN